MCSKQAQVAVAGGSGMTGSVFLKILEARQATPANQIYLKKHPLDRHLCGARFAFSHITSSHDIAATMIQWHMPGSQTFNKKERFLISRV